MNNTAKNNRKPGMSPGEFITRLRGDKPTFICTYANLRHEANKFKPREFVIHDPAEVPDFLEVFDKDGRACYFACNTMKGKDRGKDHLASIDLVHVDVDCKGVVETTKQIEAALCKLKLPPTCVVNSGNGYHVYWRFKKSVPPSQRASFEKFLTRVCNPLAGDLAAAEVARVLRLPGSHNSKRGEWKEVYVIDSLSSWQSYEYRDLDMMFEELQLTPLLTRVPTPAAGSNVIDMNVWQQHARESRALSGGFNPDDLLDKMVYRDTKGHGIDATRTKIVGAIVAEGGTVEDCFRILLRPSRRAYELAKTSDDGPWSERNERSLIAGQFHYFTKKDESKPKKVKTVQPETEPPKDSKPKTTKKAATGKKREPVETDFDPPEKPIITIAGGELSNNATAGEQALIDAGEEMYEQVSRALVRVITSEVEGAHGKPTKIAELKHVKWEYLRDRLMHVADFQKWDARSEAHVPANCSKEIAETILSREGSRGFRRLAGVSTCPTMRPDGSLLILEGYDKGTRLLLVDPPALPNMPDEPTKDQALVALALLKGLLREFPFTDETARAVALAGIVTAVARGAFANAPLFIARASTPGSGKSYLWDIVSAMVSGFAMPVIAAGHSAEETEKRLGAVLMASRPLTSIDNLNGELSGDALCQMIERPIVDVRILGQSKLVRIEARGTTLFATGNNLTVVGDLCRRVLISSLDSKLERPELREFKGNPVKTVLANRGKYIAACLTIVRAYLVAGRPDKAKPLASFGDWSDSVRSALMWLGVADPVESMELARAEDPERMKSRDILRSWFDIYGTNKVTLAKVIEDANRETGGFNSRPKLPELHDAVDAIAAWRGPADVLKLGNWLRKKKGRVIDGLRLMQLPNPKGGSLWWVEPVK